MAKNPRIIDMSGRTVGQWRVVSQSGNSPRGGAMWTCVCLCGAVKSVLGSDLRSGKSLSCGCAGSRASIGTRSKTHGDSNKRLHRIWKNMTQRCTNPSNPKYPRYGGRGITICPEWRDYTAFKSWAVASGYSDNLSIERVNNDLGYSPENCVWADAKAQARNRSIVRRAKDGTPLALIAERAGIPVGVMNSRINAGGWDPLDAATKPLGVRTTERKRSSDGKYAKEPRKWRR